MERMLASASSDEQSMYKPFCTTDTPKSMSSDYGFETLHTKCKDKSFLLFFTCHFFDLVKSFPKELLPEWINHPTVFSSLSFLRHRKSNPCVISVICVRDTRTRNRRMC